MTETPLTVLYAEDLTLGKQINQLMELIKKYVSAKQTYSKNEEFQGFMDFLKKNLTARGAKYFRNERNEKIVTLLYTVVRSFNILLCVPCVFTFATFAVKKKKLNLRI